MDSSLVRAPPSSNYSEWGVNETPLHDGFVYKTVITSSVVVKRKMTLYRDKFITYHNFEQDKNDKKIWDLNRKCRLEPRAFDEVREVEKVVRPPGVWTMQTVFSADTAERIKLWMFTLTWPSSWAPQGYTSFTLGVQSREEAQYWFTKFERAIEDLKDASKSRMGTMSGRSSSRDSETDLQLQASSPSMQTISMPVHKTEDGLHSAGGDSGSGPLSLGLKIKARSLGDEPVAQVNGVSTAAAVLNSAPDIQTAALTSGSPKVSSSPKKTAAAVKFSPETKETKTEHHPEMDSPTFHTPTARANAANTAPPVSTGERWVPYKHVNGVAIYYNTRRAGIGPGPEYMASCIVRGSPKACVETLMSPDSLTTVLGPTTDMVVIKESTDRQVFRARITAPGFAGKVCAPRDLVIERLTKKEEEGIYAILYHSYPAEDHTRQQELSGGFTGWWMHPVIATATGGYTIAPLEGRGDDSEECLVTCVLHVDLGAQCSERSWFWPLSDALGLKDAFVERMLMSVILIKDEIEHKRFVVQPFTLMLGGSTPAELIEVPKRSASMIVKERRAGSMSRRGSVPLRSENLARLAATAAATAAHPQSPAASSATTGPLNKAEAHDDEFFAEADDNGPDGFPGEGDDLDTGLDENDSLSTLDEKYWCEIHRPGTSYPFKVRGPNYLKDRIKVEAGEPVYELTSVDLVIVDQPTNHIARFLPSIRRNEAAFSFICQLIIPGTPLLGLVVTFSTDVHPDSLGPPPDPWSPAASKWRPFDFVMHRFLGGSDDERNGIFKLIPHIAEGSWVIRQSVGTTPVILGRKLKTKYTRTERYIEVDVDISANSTAAYVVGMVKGATKSLIVDLAFVLEGQHKYELPEMLLGAGRFIKLDLSEAVKIDTTREIDQVPIRRTTSSVAGQ